MFVVCVVERYFHPERWRWSRRVSRRLEKSWGRHSAEWESASWWGLLAPDGVHLSDEAIDWVWLDRRDPDLFVP